MGPKMSPKQNGSPNGTQNGPQTKNGSPNGTQNGPQTKNGTLGPGTCPTWTWDMPNLDMGHAQPGHGTGPTWHGMGPTWHGTGPTFSLLTAAAGIPGPERVFQPQQSALRPMQQKPCCNCFQSILLTGSQNRPKNGPPTANRARIGSK